MKVKHFQHTMTRCEHDHFRRENWGMERKRSKARTNPEGQTLNPIVSSAAPGVIWGEMWTSMVLSGLSPTGLSVVGILMISFWGQLCSLLAAFLQCPMFLSFSKSWVLRCTLGFTLMALCTAHSGSHCWPPNHLCNLVKNSLTAQRTYAHNTSAVWTISRFC